MRIEVIQSDYFPPRTECFVYKVGCNILFKIATSKVRMHYIDCLSYCRLPSNAGQPNFQYETNDKRIYINDQVFSHFLKMENFRSKIQIRYSELPSLARNSNNKSVVSIKKI